MTLCAWCKRQIASLVGGRRSAAVSHGMCRRCLEERIARATAA